jgi:hypothetical protein
MNPLDFYRICLSVESATKLKDDFFCHRETIIFRGFELLAGWLLPLKGRLQPKYLEQDLIKDGLVY